jgi:hypothetical protein
MHKKNSDTFSLPAEDLPQEANGSLSVHISMGTEKRQKNTPKRLNDSECRPYQSIENRKHPSATDGEL